MALFSMTVGPLNSTNHPIFYILQCMSYFRNVIGTSNLVVDLL